MAEADAPRNDNPLTTYTPDVGDLLAYVRDETRRRMATAATEKPEIECLRELLSDPYIDARMIAKVNRTLLPALLARARGDEQEREDIILLLGGVRFFLFSVAADRYAWLYSAALRLPRSDAAEASALGSSGMFANTVVALKLRAMMEEARDWSDAERVETWFDDMLQRPLRERIEILRDEMQRIANMHLNSDATLQFLAREYGLGEILYRRDPAGGRKPAWQLNTLRVGTTSYVLEMTVLGASQPGQAKTQILKILKYRYRANPTISKATKQYTEHFNRLSEALQGIMVEVHGSTPWWIVMERGPTTTLEDMIVDHFRRTMSERSDFNRLKEANVVMKELFAAMGYFNAQVAAQARNDPNFDAGAVKGHFDLSPRNVLVQGPRVRDWLKEHHIVDDKGQAQFELRLIDFGFNFAAREQVAPGDIVFDVTRYCAPELKGTAGDGEFRSDIYSLGHIFLDILVPEFGYSDVSARLDQVWRHFPATASLIVSMIEQDAQHRVPHLTAFEPPLAYAELERELANAETSDGELFRSLGVLNWERKARGFFTPPIIVSVAKTMANFGRWSQDALKARRFGDARAGTRSYLDRSALYLARIERVTLAIIAIAYWIVLIALFKGAGLDKELDLIDVPGLKAVVEFFGRAIAYLGLADSFKLDWRLTLPGRLVAFSVMIIAHFYFTIIIGKISLWHLPQSGYRTGEFLLRLHPFLIGMGALAAVFFPHWWPWLSIYGCIVTAATNALLYGALKHARSVGMPELTTLASSTLDAEAKRFGRWASGMLIYGCCFLAYGVGRDWWGPQWTAQEDIKYAFIFVLINTIIVARTMLWQDGQTIRNNLLRVFDGWVRADVGRTPKTDGRGRQ